MTMTTLSSSQWLTYVHGNQCCLFGFCAIILLLALLLLSDFSIFMSLAKNETWSILSPIRVAIFRFARNSSQFKTDYIVHSFSANKHIQFLSFIAPVMECNFVAAIHHQIGNCSISKVTLIQYLLGFFSVVEILLGNNHKKDHITTQNCDNTNSFFLFTWNNFRWLNVSTEIIAAHIVMLMKFTGPA